MAKRTTTGPTTTNASTDSVNVEMKLVHPPADDTATALVVRASELAIIINKADADLAGDFLRKVRARIKVIEAHYKAVRTPVKEALKKALDAISAMETDDLAQWKAADAAVAEPLQAWILAERQRVEAAAADRVRAAQEAAQAQQKTTVLTLQAAAKAAETPEERRALTSQAKAVSAAPLMPVIERSLTTLEMPKIAGISTPTRWSARVVSLPELVAAVAAGKVSIEALQPNQKWLDGLAVERQNNLRIPGVIPESDVTLSARGTK